MWRFNNTTPLYLQIVSFMSMDIVSGKLLPGERLPTVRDLASTTAVNPNTVQKALTELERKGLCYTERTSGRFVTNDAAAITAARDEFASSFTSEYVEKMRSIGYNDSAISAAVADCINNVEVESNA
ncbi:MAG: GntR family transcriptional regulator [Clostridia bacterium]|nr:GntR family transcriptional regulator [Clostridia bacterium]